MTSFRIFSSLVTFDPIFHFIEVSKGNFNFDQPYIKCKKNLLQLSNKNDFYLYSIHQAICYVLDSPGWVT